jgi:glycosyltransferase involved in cell wall biosynthesis
MIDGKMILLGRPLNYGAGAWLRVIQHLNAIARAGRAHCPVIDIPDMREPELVWKALCESDIFVSSGGRPHDAHISTVRAWTDRGKPWVWDVDDDPMNISPHNPAYVAFGLHEVELAEPIRGEKWLWKDGEVREGRIFSLEENHKRHAAFLKMLQENVTAITTPTEYLADKLKEIAPDTPVFIRPNVLDFEEVWTLKKRPSNDGCVRIMYQGGSSHIADLDEILHVLGRIEKEYPHARFLFMGDTKAHAEKVLPPEKIERYDWTGDYESFAQRQALLGADIGIAPLCMDDLHAEFNRCKSPLKWLDYAALGIPCVAQWDLPYSPVINFGQAEDQHWNGLLARTEDDWLHCLSVLIENPDMRDTVGANAYAEAKSDWNVDGWVNTYVKQYEGILNGNDNSRN